MRLFFSPAMGFIAGLDLADYSHTGRLFGLVIAFVFHSSRGFRAIEGTLLLKAVGRRLAGETQSTPGPIT